MPFKVSKEATNDLREIGRYTQNKWGKAQRRRYLDDLDEKFHFLAENPQMGRRCEKIREGYFRFEFMSHIVFYKLGSEGVLISRVLHRNRDVKAQLNKEHRE